MADDSFETAFAAYAASAGLVAAGVDLTALHDFITSQTIPKARVAPLLNDLRDDLAAIEHERWGHWQRYMHAQCRSDAQEAEALVIPAKLVAQWERQADTPFADLTAKEQDSDREQVNRYLPLLIDRLSA